MFHIRFRNPNKPDRDVGSDAEGGGASRPSLTWEVYDEGKKYLELGMMRTNVKKRNRIQTLL